MAELREAHLGMANSTSDPSVARRWEDAFQRANLQSGPYVCTDCCSQMISSHVLGSRSYVSGLLIDTRVVALLGLRTRRNFITGKVYGDRMGRQILGA